MLHATLGSKAGRFGGQGGGGSPFPPLDRSQQALLIINTVDNTLQDIVRVARL